MCRGFDAPWRGIDGLCRRSRPEFPEARATLGQIARAVDSPAVRIANADEVRARTGFAIGGVAPVAHAGADIAVRLVDDSLLRYALVWAAAGAPNAVFPIALSLLLDLTGARVADRAVDFDQGREVDGRT